MSKTNQANQKRAASKKSAKAAPSIILNCITYLQAVAADDVAFEAADPDADGFQDLRDVHMSAAEGALKNLVELSSAAGAVPLSVSELRAKVAVLRAIWKYDMVELAGELSEDTTRFIEGLASELTEYFRQAELAEFKAKHEASKKAA